MCASVILHFIIGQAQSFNDGRTAPIASHDDFIEQVSYVVIFLILWFALTFLFHFLSEREQLGKVQNQLNHLKELDLKFRSNVDESWGLWAAIIDQLNSFSKVLGERTHLLKTFSRFVTAGVAEKALQQEIKETTGITKELTVIMSDIRNFTGISESLTPDQVVLFLNEYFSAMLEVISTLQISVDKFIGDGILAYVEPENSNSSNEENRLGVKAALAMTEKVNQLNVRFETLGLPPLKIGIGVIRGPLVIGVIGSEAKLQHTIIGDTVNKAARLESLTKELGVSIALTEQVWQSLDNEEKSRFSSFGKRNVKGINEPISVFGGPNQNIRNV